MTWAKETASPRTTSTERPASRCMLRIASVSRRASLPGSPASTIRTRSPHWPEDRSTPASTAYTSCVASGTRRSRSTWRSTGSRTRHGISLTRPATSPGELSTNSASRSDSSETSCRGPNRVARLPPARASTAHQSVRPGKTTTSSAPSSRRMSCDASSPSFSSARTAARRARSSASLLSRSSRRLCMALPSATHSASMEACICIRARR